MENTMESNFVSVEAIDEDKKHYSFLRLSCIESKELSWKAKGLHTYFMTRPSGWTINMKDFLSRSTDGQASLSTGVKELVDKSYLYHLVTRNEKKQIIKWSYLVFTQPHSIEEATAVAAEKFPKAKLFIRVNKKVSSDENLLPDPPSIGNQGAIINNSINNKHHSSFHSSSSKNKFFSSSSVMKECTDAHASDLDTRDFQSLSKENP
ncbi:MAG: hypothetical protein ABIA11_02560, partial [Patescibacteria group bacterium]